MTKKEAINAAKAKIRARLHKRVAAWIVNDEAEDRVVITGYSAGANRSPSETIRKNNDSWA